MDAGWFYDRQARPITGGQWEVLHANPDYQRLGLHEQDGWMVSTVWLGIDHSFGRGDPVIFETMIFPPDKSAEPLMREMLGTEEFQLRWHTEQMALIGHAASVDALRLGLSARRREAS